ncbi:MAG TPA: T9SS type A sorting domain-containing protein [Chitinophagales bacterium]|nr:T9SS type A sorting domain-containing protein [Chitinophagales bacterium]
MSRNLFGGLVFSSDEKNCSANFTRQIDLSARPSGIYFLTLKNNEIQRVKKIFIE